MKKNNIDKVLVLGSGALKIGEAGEFDYSGSQALKALKEEGIETILINPNIATVQTSDKIADKIYFLPITIEYVEKVIIKEKPSAILLSFGGQTALNCGVELYEKGILEKYNVEVLGTPVQSIIDTEDRQIFANILEEIDVKTPISISAENLEEAKEAAKKVGYPLMVRAAYTLGGLGSGFCNTEEELIKLASIAFSHSPQILVEESLRKWKEVEYEVVRDCNDNCITVCNMENLDPLGIHTGESIVVAPSQTLNNTEYHKLREIAIKIIRRIGIVGECNVQYALDPYSEDYRVIEVNARLSRSSALASKATGYPLAFVAAKLALGYKLNEIKNSITKVSSACFEPSLDYVVCKFPKWDLDKFEGVSKVIGSSMKSVGEVMAIGRTFEEAVQKGIRMVSQSMNGFVGNDIEIKNVEEELNNPTDKRIFAIAEAFKLGWSVEKVYKITKIDKWFLYKLHTIHNIQYLIKRHDHIEDISSELLLDAKMRGFSDLQISNLVYCQTKYNEERILRVRQERKKRGILPIVKQIDTLAGEYPAQTNYLYITYSGTSSDIEFENDNKSVIVLGSGAYRIGSSVEFDWCGVNALNTINKQGYRSIMINYNPETVSTDYDSCDKLYFEELSLERVLDIIEFENPKGVIVSTGGQIPNNLALNLHKKNVNILGTSPVNIDRAEDRGKFSTMLDELGIDQPLWSEFTCREEIDNFIEKVGYPILIRPSYVLSGAAMNIVANESELSHFLNLAKEISKDHPVVVSEFIQKAKEIEIDGVAQNGNLIIHAISEHVEFAGVHSGDATIVFPPQKLYIETIRRVKNIAKQIVKSLDISGPFNMQFLAKDNDIKVIECNLRSSRSFPFVSKMMNINMIDIATKVMLDIKMDEIKKSYYDIDYVGVKAPQFSFARLLKADPVLGVDMSSTGEVACLGENYHEALLKSMQAVGYRNPNKNILISSGPMWSKIDLLESAKLLVENGYNLYATNGTANFFKENDIEVVKLYWPQENKSPNTIDFIKEGKIDLVINIPKNHTNLEIKNGYHIRRNAIDFNVPLITNTSLAKDYIKSICSLNEDDIKIKAWQDYK